MITNIEIVKFDAPSVAEEELMKLFDMFDIMRKERDPDEPHPPRDLRLKYMRDTHPHYHEETWAVYEGTKVVGYAEYNHVKPEAPAYKNNKHIVGIGISVLPEYRRRGIGTKLLSIVLTEVKKREEVTTIFSGSQLESGINFCEKMGGLFSSEGAENRLQIKEVDWDLMDEWIKNGEKLQEEENVKLIHFEDCPDDIIKKYMEIYQETMNQQPLGEYDGKITATPETRRISESKNKEKGMFWYTFASVEANGDISGLTELFYHPQMGHKGMQNLTGVKDTYRGRGLGKWLKAHALKWFVEKYPNVKYISTGNDNTNAPMLSINDRMGFKKFKSGRSYKFDLEKLAEAINNQN